MATILSDKTTFGIDDEVQSVSDALEAYERAFPGAVASLYRYGPAAIRCRVIDRRFGGMTESRRQAQVFGIVREQASEEAYLQIWDMLCLSPDEAGKHRNLDFEDPVSLTDMADV